MFTEKKRILVPCLILVVVALALLTIARPLPTKASEPGVVLRLLEGRFEFRALGWQEVGSGRKLHIAVTAAPNSGPWWNYHLRIVAFDLDSEQMEQLAPFPRPPYFSPAATYDDTFYCRTGALYLIQSEKLGGSWRLDPTLQMLHSLRYWGSWEGELGYNGAGAPFAGPYRSTTEIFVLSFKTKVCFDRLQVGIDARPPHAAVNSEVGKGWLVIPPCEEEVTITPTFTPTDTPVPPTPTPTPLTPTVTPTVPTPTFTPTPLTPTITPTKTWTPTPTPTWTKTPTLTPTKTWTPTFTPTRTWTPTWTPTLTSEPTPTWTPPIEGEPPVQIEKKHWHDYLCPGWGQRYDIVITNVGCCPVTGLVVVDSLPRQLRFADTTDPWGRNSGGSYSAARHEVEWTIGCLGPGQQVKLHLHVYIYTSVPIGAEIRNRVSIFSNRELIADAANSFVVACPTGK